MPALIFFPPEYQMICSYFRVYFSWSKHCLIDTVGGDTPLFCTSGSMCSFANLLLSTAAFSVEQHTSEHHQVLHSKISEFERLQKFELSGLVETEYHGSPVVYINPDTNESFVVGVHVGDTDQKGKQLVVTFHEILWLLATRFGMHVPF